MTTTYHDFALPLAWPDQTARGEEKWMRWLKKIGLIKNLNFKVGHAAIVMIRRSDGQLKYFDFGRYVTPLGDGRARSALSYPSLELTTRAFFLADGSLGNLESILDELHQKEFATHGSGRLLCSVCEGVSYENGVRFAEDVVQQGPTKYGPLAPGNNSCSRYVAQILTAAMPTDDRRIQRILYPEFIKASPTSNVVNAVSDRRIFCYDQGTLQEWNMGRRRSLRFQLRLLKPNFTKSGALLLPSDAKPGQVHAPKRIPEIPASAQWLGGIGEGKWFTLLWKGGHYEITRYYDDGKIDYRVYCEPDLANFDPEQPFEFTYQIDYRKHIIRQGTREFAFLSRTADLAQEHAQRRYAAQHDSTH